MAWILGIGIFLFLLFAFPAFRVFAAAIAILAAVAIYAMFQHDRRQSAEYAAQRQAQARAEAALWSTPSGSDLEFRDVTFSKPQYSNYLPTGTTMTASVLNTTDHAITALTVGLTAYDCPDWQTPTERCPIVGRAQETARTTIPSHELRGIELRFDLDAFPAKTTALNFKYKAVSVRH